MASHKSTKKSIRKAARQRAVNVNRISRIRTFVKKVETSISSGAEKNVILAAFSDAQKELMRGVTKNVLHKNAVSRKISRLSKKVKSAISE